LNTSSSIYSKNNFNKEDYAMRIHRFPFLPRQVSSLLVFVFLFALIGSIGTSVFLSPPAAEAQGFPKGFLHRNDPLVQEAIEVQHRHLGNLMRIRDVVGTGIGMGPDGLPAIKVFTARHGVPGIPQWLETVPVQVEVTGMIVALEDTTARYRPAPIGVSTGHPDITAGTIGARVKDASGRVFALSNNHVYANINKANIGDSALQPGTYDGGINPDDKIGTLFDFQLINFSGGSNTIDAAIALSSIPDLGNSTLEDGYGTPSSVTADAYVGLPVKKYGRTTGMTHGKVSTISLTVNVCYESRGIFCSKSAKFVDQIGISPGTFSAGGDSGSLIVTDDDNNNPVGLLFAGSSTLTIANKIDLVLDHFGVTIDDQAGPKPEPPAAPSGLTATVISDSQINLAWTDNSNNETGFKIERCTGNDCTDFEPIAEVGANVTNYSNTGLTASTTYTYRVLAYNSGGDSGYSNSASATTHAAPAVPAAPTNLTATAVSRSQIKLSWTDNSGNETGFKIERCKGATCTNFSQIATVDENVTTYTNTNLSKNTTYRYRVRAYNAAGNSADYSNIASATTLRR
jgi:hypothetical protein